MFLYYCDKLIPGPLSLKMSYIARHHCVSAVPLPCRDRKTVPERHVTATRELPGQTDRQTDSPSWIAEGLGSTLTWVPGRTEDTRSLDRPLTTRQHPSKPSSADVTESSGGRSVNSCSQLDTQYSDVRTSYVRRTLCIQSTRERTDLWGRTTGRITFDSVFGAHEHRTVQ